MKKLIDSKRFGPWALVTGASSGIGKEFAIQLAANGLNLVLTARRISLLEDLGKSLSQEYGIKYKTINIDLTNEKFMDTLRFVTDPLDIGLVVSNAGIAHSGEFIKTDFGKLEDMVQVNVNAHLAVCHHFGQKMAEKKRGGIILLSAMGALNGVPFMANPAGTKAYVYSLGLGLHTELERHGVYLTVLMPGATDTEAMGDLGLQAKDLPMKPMLPPQVVREALTALAENQPVIIPGRLNRIMNAIAPASLPGKMMGKMLAKNHGIKL